MNFLRRLLRRLGLGRRRRVTGLDPSATLPCAWCGVVKETTLEEVWSDAFLRGQPVRLCRECAEFCDWG